MKQSHVVGACISLTLLDLTGAQVAADVSRSGSGDPQGGPEVQACLQPDVANHSYETRNDGNQTYWFPHRSWVKSDCQGGLVDTWIQAADRVDHSARGYYRTSNGAWKFATANPNIADGNTHVLIANLLPGTRFNHGYAYGADTLNWF